MKTFTLFLVFIFLSNSVFAQSSSSAQILDAAALNEQVNPCDNFYEFACGTWIEKTDIPPDRSSIGRQEAPMTENFDRQLNSILESYAHGDFRIPSTYAMKLGAFYNSCMNADTNQSAALKSLHSRFDKIRAAKNPTDYARLMAELNLDGVVGFFNFYSMQDYADSSKVLGDLSQGGFALGNPAYYLEQTAPSKDLRKKYTLHISKMFSLLGIDAKKAAAYATFILKFETQLAAQALAVEDQNDPTILNNPVDFTGLQKLAPHFDWNVYLDILKAPKIHFNVDSPKYFAAFDKVWAQASKDQLDIYLMWQTLHTFEKFLGGEFKKAHFDFWGVYLGGAKVMPEKWKSCTYATQEHMGEALAEAYLTTFDGNALKHKTESMISAIRNAFIEDLQVLTTGVLGWLDATTASEAKEKALKISTKIGASDKVKDYSKVVVTNDNYLENVIRIWQFETKMDIAKIGKPADSSEWSMMPWEINAYYDRANNEFVFPFGILMPPSLDLTASDGANFGSLGGGTIGHELTHGFDNNGAAYDSRGNLRNWWTEETQKKFESKAQCFVNQANQYKIKEVDLPVNGSLTLEENLADQGGVKLGYMALEKILAMRPEAPLWNDKYTERQQYWIAYAQSWCTKSTVQDLRAQMMNDEHPPAEFRVNAVMMNRPEFAKDFQCSSGAPMAPKNRCALW